MTTETELNANVRKRMEQIAKAMIQSQIPQSAFDTGCLTIRERDAFNAAWRENAGS